MNKQQKFTPKYWVGHIKANDDVVLITASKSKSDACKKMELVFGEDWEIDDRFAVDLMELRICETSQSSKSNNSRSTSSCHAIVSMFGQRKRCEVTAHGDPKKEYTSKQTLWIEREEDYYAMSHYKPPFCVLHRRDWLRGKELE
jgi:hypothetical protein